MNGTQAIVITVKLLANDKDILHNQGSPDFGTPEPWNRKWRKMMNGFS